MWCPMPSGDNLPPTTLVLGMGGRVEERVSREWRPCGAEPNGCRNWFRHGNKQYCSVPCQNGAEAGSAEVSRRRGQATGGALAASRRERGQRLISGQPADDRVGSTCWSHSCRSNHHGLRSNLPPLSGIGTLSSRLRRRRGAKLPRSSFAFIGPVAAVTGTAARERATNGIGRRSAVSRGWCRLHRYRLIVHLTGRRLDRQPYAAAGRRRGGRRHRLNWRRRRATSRRPDPVVAAFTVGHLHRRASHDRRLQPIADPPSGA